MSSDDKSPRGSFRVLTRTRTGYQSAVMYDVQLQIVEKWDGRSPLVVGGGSGGENSGTHFIRPLNSLPALPSASAGPATGGRRP